MMVDETKHLFWSFADPSDIKLFTCKRCGHRESIEDLKHDPFKCAFCGYALRHNDMKGKIVMVEKEEEKVTDYGGEEKEESNMENTDNE